MRGAAPSRIALVGLFQLLQCSSEFSLGSQDVHLLEQRLLVGRIRLKNSCELDQSLIRLPCFQEGLSQKKPSTRILGLDAERRPQVRYCFTSPFGSG